MLRSCPVCGGKEFRRQKVLWPELIAQWELSAEETAYVDEQQGYLCAGCGSNLRSMTLAHALMRALDFEGDFRGFCTESLISREWSLIEINAAGSLTPWLRRFKSYRLAEYPAIDMHDMREIPDGSYDIVIHSDTLEHLREPVRALEECRRILSPRGLLAYTVPVIVGRLTRRRDGLPASYHGDPSSLREDICVATEYGADYWSQLMTAGFRRVEIHTLAFPQSIATVAWKA